MEIKQAQKIVAVLIVSFFVIGNMLGSAAQIYTGVSGEGTDTVVLENTGILNSKVTQFSLSPSASSDIIPVTISSADSFNGVVLLEDRQLPADASGYEYLHYYLDPACTDEISQDRTDYDPSDVHLSVDLTGNEIVVYQRAEEVAAVDSFDIYDYVMTCDDLTGWSGDTAAASVTNGIITYYHSAGEGGILTDQKFNPNTVIEFRHRIPNGPNQVFGLRNGDGDLSRFAGHVDSSSSRNWIFYSNNYVTTDWDLSDYTVKRFVWTSSSLRAYEDGVEKVNSPITDSLTGPESFELYGSQGTQYLDWIVSYPYHEVSYAYGEPLKTSVTNKGMTVGDHRVFYDGELDGKLTYSNGVSYVGTVEASKLVKGDLPVIPVGQQQTIRVDHGLEYSVTYQPVNMDVNSPDLFKAGEDLTVNTQLVTVDGTYLDDQPAKMRVRLVDAAGNQYIDEIVESTSFMVPGKYLKNGHYQLRLSYFGERFGGWSNEVLADFDTGSQGFTVSWSPNQASAGSFTGVVDATMGMFDTSVKGWMKVPVIADILALLLSIVGVEV